jgi:hypothetical protein
MRRGILVVGMLGVLVWTLPVTAGDCPDGNVLSAMETAMESVQKVSPLDFSSVVSAGAQLKKDRTKIRVCLSNGELSIAEMANDYVLPLTDTSQFIAVVSFTNGGEPVTEGEYSAASGYGKPFWAFAEIRVKVGEKGTTVSLGVAQGTATITKLSEDRVCGSFDLRTTDDASFPGVITGEFSCPLEVSRW